MLFLTFRWICDVCDGQVDTTVTDDPHSVIYPDNGLPEGWQIPYEGTIRVICPECRKVERK